MFGWFRKVLNDKDLDVSKLVKYINMNKFFIRNSVGFGFVSTPELFDNGHFEVGIGRIMSGYGDWGGGASHAYDSPIKIVIDTDFNIIDIDTSSYYNSDNSQETERLCMKFIKDREFEKLKMPVESSLYKTLIECFTHVGEKKHMGIDGLFEEVGEPENVLVY